MFACALSEATPDNEIDAAISLNFIQNDIRFVFKFTDKVAGLIEDFSFVGEYLNDIAIIYVVHWCFKYQSAGIFHCIEEDRCDFAAEADATGSLVRNPGHVLTEEPQHGVGSGFT